MSSLEQRHAGILLHPTSLPGPHGIGDLGPELHRFIEWLADAGFGLWQVLPLGPTGYGDSPYQCFSAFAGNTYLVSPELLVEEGLLSKSDLKKAPRFPADRVDYGPAIEWKNHLLGLAFERCVADRGTPVARRFSSWRRKNQVRAWLDDFALFMALKKAHGGAVWNTWPEPLRLRDEKALVKFRRDNAREIDFQSFCQFLFFEQWERVRAACRDRRIAIVGDAPIYVAFDSADTWANQELFKLDAAGNPTCVAGVPPDYFSATGQLWGNPIYRYDRMAKNGFLWWVLRIGAMMDTVDIIRLDHFRGFEAYWEVPAGEETAINGKWVPGPREALFDALAKAHGKLPIIAENLGVITPEVEALREQFDLPGMKVLQFGFASLSKKRPLVPDPDNVFHPHKIEPTSVVYTGTHDNPTTVQWWEEFATPAEKALLQTMVARSVEGAEAAEVLVRIALASVGRTVLIPMQDILALGGEARMNYPGRASGNWGWRMSQRATSRKLARAMGEQLLLFDRHKDQALIAEELLEKQSAAARARKP